MAGRAHSCLLLCPPCTSDSLSGSELTHTQIYPSKSGSCRPSARVETTTYRHARRKARCTVAVMPRCIAEHRYSAAPGAGCSPFDLAAAAAAAAEVATVGPEVGLAVLVAVGLAVLAAPVVSVAGDLRNRSS